MCHLVVEGGYGSTPSSYTDFLTVGSTGYSVSRKKVSREGCRFALVLEGGSGIPCLPEVTPVTTD